MNANNIRGFIYQNYHKRIGFSKEESYCSLKGLKKKGLLLLANKLIKKIPYSRKTVRKGEKVDSNSSIYSDTKKCKFFERKKCKNNKTSTCF